MATDWNEVLASTSSLEAFLCGVDEQLAAERERQVRHLCLREALDKIRPRLEEAEQLHCAALVEQLLALKETAEAELRSLEAERLSPSPAVATPSEPAPPAVPEPAEEPPAAAAPSLEPEKAAEAEEPEEPPARESARPLPEVQADLDRVAAALEQDVGETRGGRARLLGVGCMLRGCWQELQRLQESCSEAEQLFERLREAVNGHPHGGYALPLALPRRPREGAVWLDLATRYDGLALCLDAVDFVLGLDDIKVKKTQLEQLLSAAAAAQSRLEKAIRSEFEDVSEPLQREVRKQITELQKQNRYSLTGLSSRALDWKLEEALKTLPERLSQLRAEVETKRRRESALAGLAEFLQPDGADPESPEWADAFRAQVRACLEAGVRPSRVPLRDGVLPHVELLEDDEAFKVVVREVYKELDRQAVAEEKNTPPPPKELDPETAQRLTELLPVTRGKKCLFLGGVPREDIRAAIEERLELAELLWPETKAQTNISKHRPAVEKAHIVALLIKFMRKGFKQAGHWQRDGQRLVRLPHGYGVPQVIHEFHQQLAPNR